MEEYTSAELAETKAPPPETPLDDVLETIDCLLHREIARIQLSTQHKIKHLRERRSCIDETVSLQYPNLGESERGATVDDMLVQLIIKARNKAALEIDNLKREAFTKKSRAKKALQPQKHGT